MTKVLLVEDDEIQSEVTQKHLENEGFEVSLAFDGRQAIDKAQTILPDVILMDMNLPILDGLEATRFLKSHPKLNTTPIIALTAFTHAYVRTSALSAGFNDFETKPLHYPRLIKKIKRITLALSTEVQSSRRSLILVVDDEEMFREILIKKLQDDTHRVLTAANGFEAMAKVQEYDFDLILLDIMMPEMDGMQVLKFLKVNNHLQKIPVIMVSGVEDDEVFLECVRTGAQDCVSKPFNFSQLKGRIDLSLERKVFSDQELCYIQLLEKEKDRAEQLLKVILPPSAIIELKMSGVVQPKRYENVTVLFSDVVGFTQFCDEHPPDVTVKYLQELVDLFESVASIYGLEKVKTIGDAFMAVGGLFTEMDDPIYQTVQCALEMVSEVSRLSSGWEIRLGLHSGGVYGGVVGTKQYCFDVWGSTVNLASRIEGGGEVNQVTVSSAVWNHVKDRVDGRSLGLMEFKGLGEEEVFVIENIKGEV